MEATLRACWLKQRQTGLSTDQQVPLGGSAARSRHEGAYDSDAAAILANPENYYVNVHTTACPTGTIRGQLA